MGEFSPPYLPERNPVTHKAHRREVLWQITAPLILGVIVIVVLAVLASLGTSSNVSRWADVSLIWLILPTLLIFFVFLVLLGAIVFGLLWLLRNIPIYARKAQDLVASIGAQVRRISDAVVEPFLRVQSFMARLQVLRRML